jgi:hypothetical protein
MIWKRFGRLDEIFSRKERIQPIGHFFVTDSPLVFSIPLSGLLFMIIKFKKKMITIVKKKRKKSWSVQTIGPIVLVGSSLFPPPSLSAPTRLNVKFFKPCVLCRSHSTKVKTSENERHRSASGAPTKQKTHTGCTEASFFVFGSS